MSVLYDQKALESRQNFDISKVGYYTDMYIHDVKIIKENLLCNTIIDLAWAIANFYRSDNSK